MDEDDNPIVEAYNFFFLNADCNCADADDYFRKRGKVLHRLREGILGNPGYLGIFCGLMLGWVCIAGYYAILFAESIGVLLGEEPAQISDDAYLARMLTGLFMLFVVWLASRWCIDSYENRKSLIAEACAGVKKSCLRSCLCVCWRGRTVRSKVWMLFSLVFCVFFGVTAGMYLSVDIAGNGIWDKLGTFVVVTICVWIGCVRACSLSIGLWGRARLFAIPLVGTLVLVLLGALLKLVVVLDGFIFSVIKFGVSASIMFNLIWFGLMGAYLMIHEYESMRVAGQLSSLGKRQVMAISDWVRRDIFVWLVSGALATFALIVLECMGLLLLALL